MNEFPWFDAQKVIDLALVVTAAVAVGLIVLQAAYLLLLAIALGRSKRSSEK